MSSRIRTSGIMTLVAPTPGATTPLQDLIAGLTTDGLTAKLDRLWVFAQPTEAEALVDIIASATATNVNSTTFTANLGYTGQDLAAPARYIDSNYTPATHGVNYTQNSAHISAWSITNAAPANGGALMGCSDGGTSHATSIYDTYLDGNMYLRINDNSASGSQGAPGTRIGHWLINRDTSTTTQAYQDGSSFSSPNAASGPLPAFNILIAADNNGAGGAILGTPNQLAMVSIGGSLSAGDVTNFYNRLRTYMTAVGVP